jgi:hypothetical protein
MIQTALLPNCAAEDRRQPVEPVFRPRPLIRIPRRKPSPWQLYLPGMGLSDDSSEVLLPPNADDAALCRGADDATARPQPTCPNCGGRAFDEDGDCTSCWEPGVVAVAGRPRRRWQMGL